MTTFRLYVPEDLMEAEPETELTCSDLDIHVCLQQPERKSPTPKRRKSFWKRWKNKVESITEERMEEEGGAAVLTGVKPRENDIGPTEDSNEVIHLPEVDSGGAEEEKNKNGAHKDVCELPLQEEELQELLSLYQKWQNIWSEEVEEFDDIADLAEEMTEELEEQVKDKSIRRRFLNWLNGVLQDHYAKKIARTYRRELEDGYRIYRPSYMVPPVTRAQREKRKREKLIHRDEQRQKVKEVLDTYWEKKRHLKEELRLKEEERYEKWMAAHGLNVPESSPAEPKKRMSQWEKRFLRLKEFFFHQSN